MNFHLKEVEVKIQKASFGSIKILEIKENTIKIKENLVVINDDEIQFKGIRVFQRNGNIDIYPNMLKN